MLLLGLVTGCAHYTRTARLDFVEIGPEGILQMASEQAGSIGSLLTTGTIQISSGRGAFTARGMVLYAEPDSIRIDVSIVLGGLVVQALVTGNDIQIYLPVERVVLEGKVSPGGALDFQGISLERAVLLEMIMGPALAWNWVDLAARVDQYDVGPEQINLGIGRPDGSRLLFSMDTDLEYRKATRLDSRGQVIVETLFTNYKRTRSTHLPRKTVLRYPYEGFELVFEVVNRTEEPDRSPEDFRLQLPANVQHLPLHALIPPLSLQ